MTTVELLEAEALKLSQGDRSRLVERLVASLDEDEEIEAAWDAIAEDRETNPLEQNSNAASFDDVFTRLEARFPG